MMLMRSERIWCVLAPLGVASLTASPVQATQPGPVFEIEFAIPRRADAPEPAFHRITDIQLSRDGNVVMVADNLNVSIRFFNRTGTLLREFGRRGSGPAEFTGAVTLEIIGERLFAIDIGSRRTTWFDLEGRYGGDRVHPSLERNGIWTWQASRPVRFEQYVAVNLQSFGPTSGFAPDMRKKTMLLDARGRVLDTLAVFHSGNAYAFHRANPDVTIVAESFGPAGDWTLAGDSMVVAFDALTGVARWLRVERGTARLLRSRRLGWTPVPLRVSTERGLDLRRRIAAPRRAEPGDIIVVYPEHETRITGISRVASNGDLWIQLAVSSDSTVEPVHDEYLIVPYDPGAPVARATLPDDFRLLRVIDDLLLGIHFGADDVQTVRAYRMRSGG